MMNSKPRRVKAKITSTVTEIAIVLLDRDGCIEEIVDIHEEIEKHDVTVAGIYAVLSVHP